MGSFSMVVMASLLVSQTAFAQALPLPPNCVTSGGYLGMRVQLLTDASVFAVVSSTIPLDSHTKYDTGTISADQIICNNGLLFAQVDFDGGVDGWVNAALQQFTSSNIPTGYPKPGDRITLASDPVGPTLGSTYSYPGGTLLGSDHRRGDTGILQAPGLSIYGGSNWVKVDFDGGTDGWVRADATPSLVNYPNLSFSNFTLQIDPARNRNILISVTILNGSSIAASSSYLLLATNVDQANGQGNLYSIPALSPNQSFSVTRSVVFPSSKKITAYGTLDVFNQVMETIESDNTKNVSYPTGTAMQDVVSPVASANQSSTPGTSLMADQLNAMTAVLNQLLGMLH
jgi:hypothetical protein